MTRRIKITQEIAAAIASGATVPAAEAAATEAPTPAAPDPATPAAAATEAPAATTETTEAPAPEAAAATTTEPAASATPAAPAPQTSNTELVTFLQTELTNARAAHEQTRVELATLTARHTEMSAVLPGMNKTIRLMTQRLSVALNSSPVGLDKLEGQPLVDLFNSLNAEFEKRFSVGPKARTSAEVSADTTVAAGQTPQRAAAVQATRLP